MFKIELGTKVKDKITGLTGIVVCKAEWLYGCIRYVVQPQELKDGKPVDNCSFDEDQLKVIEPERPAKSSLRGGPKDTLTRGFEVKRG